MTFFAINLTKVEAAVSYKPELSQTYGLDLLGSDPCVLLPTGHHLQVDEAPSQRVLPVYHLQLLPRHLQPCADWQYISSPSGWTLSSVQWANIYHTIFNSVIFFIPVLIIVSSYVRIFNIMDRSDFSKNYLVYCTEIRDNEVKTSWVEQSHTQVSSLNS